jgi:hypothetical protein
VTDREFPRLQLRGSAGFSPASLLISPDPVNVDPVDPDKNARTKEVEKEQNPLAFLPASCQNESEWIEV